LPSFVLDFGPCCPQEGSKHYNGFLFRQYYLNSERQATGEESTRGMSFPPGIDSFWTRNPLEEWFFRWESLASGRGTHWRMDIPPEITTPLMRN
jgi:hypothetical protein